MPVANSATVTLTPIVSFNGQTLPANWLSSLVELRIERQFQVPSRVTLRFVDPGYQLLDSHVVSLGTTIDVTDPGDQTSLVAAEVTSVAIDQRDGEQPELVVVGHDRSHRLGRSASVQTFAQMTYSDVVAQLAAAAGLTCDSDSTQQTFDYFMKADSDLGLICELARRVGYDWWVDGTALYFKAPSADGTTVSLDPAVGLRSLSVRASGHHPDAVTVDGWDRDQQSLVTNTAQSSAATVKASSTLADMVSERSGAFGTGTFVTAGMGVHTQSEASTVSQAMVERGAACAVSVQGVTAGNPALKPGVTAKITGSSSLSGTYPVTRVEHLYRPVRGFVTRFYSGDRQPATLLDTIGGRAVPNPTHHNPGLHVGVVTNIDQPTGRVKVTFPGSGQPEETGWARVVAIGGGANRGSVFIPEVNDEVLVAFEGGDPRQPVVIGGLYGAKSTFPSSTTIADGQVQSRGITSRLGHGVQLLDGTDPTKQAIELSLAGGQHKLHMGKDKMTITVPQGYEFTIAAGDSSISIGTDGGITISAPTVSVTGQQSVKLSGAQIQVAADAELTLQGQAQASLKGAMVQIQAEGPLQAQGEPVMIN